VLDPQNPFAAPSDLPFGLPPLDRIREEHYLPAFEAGMAEQRAEVEAIATDPGPPTVENTLEALERSGRLLGRVASVFFNLAASASTPGLREIEAAVVPRLSAHQDAVLLDARLFTRVAALAEAAGDPATDAEVRRLAQRYRTDFVRAGAGLGGAEQERLRALNAELSALTTSFTSTLLAETAELAVHVQHREQLEGLSDEAVSSARERARARGLDGYLLALAQPSVQPALARLRDRSVRARLYRASVSRGSRGGEHDTRAIITRIAALRAERAGLLGYPHHAAYVIEDQTAGTLEAVVSMLGALVGPAVDNARAEAAELERALEADGEAGPLQPWDWAYYAEAVKRRRYAVDAEQVAPYLELGSVVSEGVFHAAGVLYGLRFERREDLPTYHRDVEVYEVTQADGAPLGLFLADWYARDDKRGGAWMSTFVDQSHLMGDRPVTVVTLNVPRPGPGEPVLLSVDLVRTAFHEFGHVLHGLLSDVRYPRLSGTNVPRDFVEFPSQVNEMWAWWPDVMRRYAVHRTTGEPLPPDVAGRLVAARSYGQGFATVELLAAALLDLEWHCLDPGDPPMEPEGVADFERVALERHGLVVSGIAPRYRSTYFSHIFGGGYSAGYYSYLWSEVLDADTVEWFAERGGLLPENGRAFREGLLSRGGAVDPLEAYAAVVGRPPRVEPLLERRGLVPVGT
jgi:peptidyl-dipeptidase Dcp